MKNKYLVALELNIPEVKNQKLLWYILGENLEKAMENAKGILMTEARKSKIKRVLYDLSGDSVEIGAKSASIFRKSGRVIQLEGVITVSNFVNKDGKKIELFKSLS